MADWHALFYRASSALARLPAMRPVIDVPTGDITRTATWLPNDRWILIAQLNQWCGLKWIQVGYPFANGTGCLHTYDTSTGVGFLDAVETDRCSWRR
jgi:hypothetical protein